MKYQAITVEHDDVEIVVTNIVNPASFLSRNQGEPVYHNCLETIEATYSSHPDLKDTSFDDAETWFTDGSSYIIGGKQHAGPYGVQKGMSTQVGEETLTAYMVALGKQLREIKKHVAGTRSIGLDGPVHDIQPGDYVYVKSLTEKTLEPLWEGSFQVLLTTFTAIKIKEQSAWINHTRVKKAPETPWKVTPGDDELKRKLTRTK
ncbi:hypothetical protein HGM15179_018883 [Zosterops borbonicus]|uniref:Murine leukemia virus integrase C-terminal domain-containing protein n=1 Tax=Zosterops borbonicus TaxID=364589 RepID=A0A8K1DAV9_9PASS|nr:hypothetical protein HGM15179_018883 [Zosterops borbonicus]